MESRELKASIRQERNCAPRANWHWTAALRQAMVLRTLASASKKRSERAWACAVSFAGGARSGKRCSFMQIKWTARGL
eukprot:6195165-Pleurochrysis_carterae.AAC.1